jgi:hypothetical protein
MMTGREDLPLPDYDHYSASRLGHAVRSLEFDDLVTLLEYEGDHADRPQVKEILAARMEELASGSTPSPGRPPPGTPPADVPPRGSPVRPESAAEPINPPPHGVPANAPSRRHDQD